VSDIAKFELLAQCYRSDIARLDAIIEASWYLAQLHPIEVPSDDVDLLAHMEACKVEKHNIELKLPDLESLIEEMKRGEEIQGLEVSP